MHLSYVLFPAALGAISHAAIFIHGEHHRKGPLWLSLALLILSLTFIGQILATNVDNQEAAVNVLSAALSFNASLFSSILVYRVFFHRLRSFPGPFLAKTTKFWHVWKVINKSDNFRQLDKLHQTYGDFVRTGPNEVTIFKPDALYAIHGPGSKTTKTCWYDVLEPLIALNTTRSKNLHGKRRRIWNRGFSSKALHEYEDRVAYYTQELYDKIIMFAGRPMNITVWTRYFSFDVMGDLAFGRSFKMMKNERNHFAVATLRQGMAVIGPFTPVPWLFIIGKTIPGIAGRWKRMLAWISEQMMWRLKTEMATPDIMSHIIKASAQDNRIKQDMPYLTGDAAAIVIAGSDTVASSLTYLFYYLAKCPQQTATLRAELHALSDRFAISELEKCNHLNGFINETLRLQPPVPSGVLRNTPPEGLTIGGLYIPGNTTVLVPTYTLGRRSDCFENADDFIPERWYSRPHLVKNKDAFAPFSIGTYSCVGKGLALMELRTVICKVVMNFDVAFAPREDGRRVVDDARDTFTLSPGELELVFHPLSR